MCPPLQIIFLALALSSSAAFAQACPQQSMGGSQCVANPSTLQISAFSVCKKVTNDHASGLALMIPTNSNNEFTTFLSHLPPGVTAASCAVPINGQCGPANGSYTPTAPASGYCNVGPLAGLSGSGPWSWQCLGSNGGSTASCSANLGCVSGVKKFTAFQSNGNACTGIYVGILMCNTLCDKCVSGQWQNVFKSCAPQNQAPCSFFFTNMQTQCNAS